MLQDGYLQQEAKINQFPLKRRVPSLSLSRVHRLKGVVSSQRSLPRVRTAGALRRHSTAQRRTSTGGLQRLPRACQALGFLPVPLAEDPRMPAAGRATPRRPAWVCTEKPRGCNNPREPVRNTGKEEGRESLQSAKAICLPETTSVSQYGKPKLRPRPRGRAGAPRGERSGARRGEPRLPLAKDDMLAGGRAPCGRNLREPRPACCEGRGTDTGPSGSCLPSPRSPPRAGSPEQFKFH